MIDVENYKAKSGRHAGKGKGYDDSVTPASNSLRRKRRFLQDYKMDIGCENEECRWDDEFTPEMLHFDHLDPSLKHPGLKTRGSRRGLASLSWKELVIEISKCQIICANCHAKKTVDEGEHI